MPHNDLSGTWSYRAFHNDPDLEKPFDALRFATARLELRADGDSRLVGKLSGEGWGTWTEWSLDLDGTYDGSEITLRGRNVIEGETWIYDYRGRLLPEWSHAIDARPVLCGSVIRTAARERHDAVAGVHATFVAVKRDED